MGEGKKKKTDTEKPVTSKTLSSSELSELSPPHPEETEAKVVKRGRGSTARSKKTNSITRKGLLKDTYRVAN